MEIFFKNNLNSSDQLQIGQLLSAPTADSAANTGACFVPTPALADILDADSWWFAMQEKDLLLGSGLLYRQQPGSRKRCLFCENPDVQKVHIQSCHPQSDKQPCIPGEDPFPA